MLTKRQDWRLNPCGNSVQASLMEALVCGGSAARLGPRSNCTWGTNHQLHQFLAQTLSLRLKQPFSCLSWLLTSGTKGQPPHTRCLRISRPQPGRRQQPQCRRGRSGGVPRGIRCRCRTGMRLVEGEDGLIHVGGVEHAERHQQVEIFNSESGDLLEQAGLLPSW